MGYSPETYSTETSSAHKGWMFRAPEALSLSTEISSSFSLQCFWFGALKFFHSFSVQQRGYRVLILTMQPLSYTCHSQPYNKVIVVLLDDGTSNCTQQSMGRACTPFLRFVFLICTFWLRSNTLKGKDFHLHLAKNGFSLADNRQGSKTRRLPSQVCCTYTRNKSSSFPVNYSNNNWVCFS